MMWHIVRWSDVPEPPVEPPEPRWMGICWACGGDIYEGEGMSEDGLCAECAEENKTQGGK